MDRYAIESQKMLTLIQCKSCRVGLAVHSDDERTIQRSINQFQQRHICRNLKAEVRHGEERAKTDRAGRRFVL